MIPDSDLARLGFTTSPDKPGLWRHTESGFEMQEMPLQDCYYNRNMQALIDDLHDLYRIFFAVTGVQLHRLK